MSEHKSTYCFMHYYANLWWPLCSFLFYGVKRGHNLQPLALGGHENSCVYWVNLRLSVSWWPIGWESVFIFYQIPISFLLFVSSSVFLVFTVIFKWITTPNCYPAYFFSRQEIQISWAQYAFMSLEIAFWNSMSSKSIHRWDQ